MHNKFHKNSQELEDLKYYLALWLMPDFGKKQWRLLLENNLLDIKTQLSFLAGINQTTQNIFSAPTKNSKTNAKIQKISNFAKIALDDINKLPYADLIHKHLNWLNSNSRNFILTYANFPSCLKQIKDPPILLCGIGDKSVLRCNSVGVVGSRNASANGRKIAFDFSAQLAKKNLVIVSGLALGIDGEAHKGAITSGKTLAVMATGIDVIYPKTHIALARQIVQNGAIITEMPLGTAPLPGLFPVRNRIIVGMSLGTFIVEASLRSGSLISARLANEAGRSVYAAPSMLNNPQTYGTNKLIQQGATIVLEAEDIYKDIEPQLDILETSEFYDFASSNQLRFDIKNINNSLVATKENLDLATNLSKDQKDIWDKLSVVGVSTDDLCELLQKNVEEVQIVLMQLELQGLVEQTGGGWIKKL